MAAQWSEADYKLVRKARHETDGFLRALEPGLFKYREPVIMIVCSDWERRYDMVQHIAYLRGFNKTEDPRVHLFSWHGGPVRLAPHSTTNGGFTNANRIFLGEISDAIQLTGFNEIIACNHWPCRKCLERKMNLRDAMRQFIAAKYLIEKENEGVNVRTPFHLDYEDLPPQGMKSYHLDPKQCSSRLEHLSI